MSDLLIENGLVVFEESVQAADILIRDEKIAGIFAPGACIETVEKVIDAKGMYIMPGAIDPHMHLGLYSSFADSYRLDSQRELIGGMTTLVEYHRGKGNYFDTVKAEIDEATGNSYVDFAISLGLCAKKHMEELEGYIKELGITSFKFFFDKQDIAHTFYDIPKEDALTLDKADLYYVLKKLAEIDPKCMLCVHCEDPDMFRAFLKEVKKKNPNSTSVADWDAARPDFVETNCAISGMLINGEVNGNMYCVHTSAKKTIDAYRALKKAGINLGKVSIETCPQYLLLDKDTATLDAKVNPALHSKEDNEALWEGIREGLVNTIGTDNVPVNKEKKYEKGNTLWDVWVGFGTSGIAMPALISEGYLKRNIPLTTIAKVLSINTARLFNLQDKGEIKVGYDADLAIVDMTWERTITPDLFGFTDFSIYEGMTFKGWPRYTISRGEIMQIDGRIVGKQDHGKYLFRKL